MNAIKFLLIALLLTLFLLFIAQNAGYVEVRFLYSVYSVPLFVLLLFSFALGFLLPSVYYLFRDVFLRKKLATLEEAFRELSRGYLNRGEKLLSSASRSMPALKWLIAELLHRQGRTEELSNLDDHASATAGYILLKEGRLDEARQRFLRALSLDAENLKALKGLRDLSALEENWELALEYQEKVLQLCERWEKEKQKAIKAEILSKVYLQRGEAKLVEKAFDLAPTPFVYSTYLIHLLSQEKIKEANKLLERVFSAGYQREVLWNLLEREEVLAKLLPAIDARSKDIDPDLLAMVYIRLNLFSKAKELEESLSTPLKALLYSSQSHREMDRYCTQSIKELFRPFACICGSLYDVYRPLCSNCLQWGEIKLRRDRHVGGP